MADVLSHFDKLTERGLKVIPLKENSKAPMCKGWTRNWDLHDSRERIRKCPDCNIGILLGEVVDVEGDSPEANETLLRIIGNYPHPAYASTRSCHHLFKNPDPKLRILKKNDIEFRAYGHQSVLPPSRHLGVTYRWLKDVHFPIPEMPDQLYQFFRSLREKNYRIIKPGHMRIRCHTCGKYQFIHQKRFQLELAAFKTMDSRWVCQDCRSVDLRPLCRKFKKGKL